MTAMSEQSCKVRLDGEEHDFPRWRLKTARGLWRTNAVEFQGVGYVYERLSRVNHACGRGANCERVFDGNGAPWSRRDPSRRAASCCWIMVMSPSAYRLKQDATASSAPTAACLLCCPRARGLRRRGPGL